jgi:hypothetical protein
MTSLIRSIAIATGIALTVTSATIANLPVAQAQANFEAFTIGDKKSASVGGSTGGSTSIPSITAGSDRSGNKCLGFGDTNPDHIMTLTQAVNKLTLKVNSGGRDTTIVIQGPEGELRCGDDTGSKKDASFSGPNWNAGTYKIWVGSMESGARGNYRLNAQAE